jgi:hypothetical protein
MKRSELLSALVDFHDPVLLSWASVAALYLNLPVPTEIIERVAASDEARKPFYSMLQKFNRTDIFPEHYRTKAAFAQSDLVNWLIYPTELGHVPDVIELTHLITVETENEPQEWFLIRFQSSQYSIRNEDGSPLWLAGWYGPYPADASPDDIFSSGGSFSNFDRWDQKAPQDHIGLTDDVPPDNLTVTSYLTD